MSAGGEAAAERWRATVGTMLELARRERRLSKRAAAREAGFTEAVWRQLEQGHRSLQGQLLVTNPRDDTLEAAALAVGLAPKRVFEAAGRPYVPSVVAVSTDRLRAAARAVLDGTTPHVSALECEHGVDGEELYADLAEALGLGRDYRPEDR